MDQESRRGLGEEGYHFAVKVVGDLVVVGVVQGNPQVRQGGGQDLRVNFDLRLRALPILVRSIWYFSSLLRGYRLVSNRSSSTGENQGTGARRPP
jgi:hypothetical protein